MGSDPSSTTYLLNEIDAHLFQELGLDIACVIYKVSM